MTKWITANDIAGKDPNAQKAFRQALREEISWHPRYGRWKVPNSSDEHQDMLRVYRERFS